MFAEIVTAVLRRFDVRLREIESNRLDVVAASERLRQQEIKRVEQRHAKRVLRIEAIACANVSYLHLQVQEFLGLLRNRGLEDADLFTAQYLDDNPSILLSSSPLSSPLNSPRKGKSGERKDFGKKQILAHCKLWSNIDDCQKIVWNPTSPHLEVTRLLVSSAQVNLAPIGDDIRLRINLSLFPGRLPNLAKITVELKLGFESTPTNPGEEFHFAIKQKGMTTTSPDGAITHIANGYERTAEGTGTCDEPEEFLYYCSKAGQLICSLPGLPRLAGITKIRLRVSTSGRWIPVTWDSKTLLHRPLLIYEELRIGSASKIRGDTFEVYENDQNDEKGTGKSIQTIQVFTSDMRTLKSDPLHRFLDARVPKLDGIELVFKDTLYREFLAREGGGGHRAYSSGSAPLYNTSDSEGGESDQELDSDADADSEEKEKEKDTLFSGVTHFDTPLAGNKKLADFYTNIHCKQNCASKFPGLSPTLHNESRFLCSTEPGFCPVWEILPFGVAAVEYLGENNYFFEVFEHESAGLRRTAAAKQEIRVPWKEPTSARVLVYRSGFLFFQLTSSVNADTPEGKKVLTERTSKSNGETLIVIFSLTLHKGKPSLCYLSRVHLETPGPLQIEVVRMPMHGSELDRAEPKAKAKAKATAKAKKEEKATWLWLALEAWVDHTRFSVFDLDGQMLGKTQLTEKPVSKMQVIEQDGNQFILLRHFKGVRANFGPLTVRSAPSFVQQILDLAIASAPPPASARETVDSV